MPVRPGSGLTVEVNTGTSQAPTWTPVNDMDAFTKGSDRNVTRRHVFGRPAPHVTLGAREQSLTLGGIFNDNDPGQVALRAAEENGTAVEVRYKWDGVNGGIQPCLVNSFSLDASADPESLMDHGFTLTPAGVATIVGTGPTLG